MASMTNKTQRPPAPTPGGRYDTTGGTMPSTPGGTNVSMWNTQFMSGPAAADKPQKWNTRFDYRPSGGSTYRPRRGDGTLDGWNVTPTGMNTKKPY